MRQISLFLTLIFLCLLGFYLERSRAQTSGFSDDFNDNVMDSAKWNIGTLHDANFNPQVQVAEQAQQLKITTPTSVIGYSGYVTASAWNFTNARASVEVVQTAGLSNDTVFALGIDNTHRYRFVVEGGQLYFQYIAGDTNGSTNLTYNPTQHRFWRFRHDPTENKILFETSSDATNWTMRSSVLSQFPNTALKVELDSGSFQQGGSATTAVFDNFKLETNSAPPSATVGLSSSTYTVGEADSSGVATITVNRGGDTSAAAAVDYATSDSSGLTPCQTNNSNIASERCDYATQVGTLRFAAGEQLKTIQIPIINDAYIEQAESFTITLRNPQGASLGATTTATVTINSDDTQTATFNPIDDQTFFIRQHYIDFLGRQPEPGGLEFWMNRMNNCPAGDTCDRIDTSKRLFQSDEFQERGFYVYRLYDAVLGRRPLYSEFVTDAATLNGSQNVTEQRQSKDALLLNFVNRAEFRAAYGQYLTANSGAATDATGFVNALCAKAGITPASKQSLINNLQNMTRDPAHTVEDFILTPEIGGVSTKFYDRGFISMQYFGYLRRDPEAGGFEFWQQKILETNHDYRFMVGGFINSDEYRFRFAYLSANSSDEPALPQQIVNTTYPMNTGTTLFVASGGNLQGAIDAAQPGDTISLERGGIYRAPFGGFRLTNKPSSSTPWIIIRSQSNVFDSNGSIPPGTRVDGTKTAHINEMPKILSQYNNSPAISADPSAHHYRLVGIEFGSDTNVTQSTDATVQLGTGGEQSIDAMPKYIIVDRCYVHGRDVSVGPFVRGITLQGKYMAVIESYVSDYHSNEDTQAICGWSGEGPFGIYNNFLEASGENILFGGEDPSVQNVVPADIEIKHNLMTKRSVWRGDTRVTVKNLFELKNARRVLVDGNTFENCWSSQGQDYAINIKSANQGGTCPWCVSEHVTFSNNLVRNIANAVDIGVRDKNLPTSADPQIVNHIKIYNNLFYNVNSDYGSFYGRIFLVRGSARYVKIIHVTAEGSYKILTADNSEEVNPYLTFKDNIVERGAFGIHVGDNEGAVALSKNFAPLTATSYQKNLLVNTSDEPANPSPDQHFDDATILGRYPNPAPAPNTASSGDTFVASTWDDVGFVDKVHFNYRLRSNSIYKNKASDGKDLGADQDAIKAALGNSAPPDFSILSDNSFRDDFNDNSRDTAKWNLSVLNEPSTSLDNLVTVFEQSQRLEITPREGVSGKHYYGYVSAGTWDVTNARVSVEVVQKTFASADTIFAIGIDSNNWYRFITEDNQLYFQDKVAGTKNGTSIAYNAAQHRFWSFRSNAATNQLFFETSSDGVTWTTRRTITTQFNISALRVEFSAGTFATQYTPSTAIFDNFHLAR